MLHVGATSLCVTWGPLVGGRVLKYRTALLLEVICQIIGIVAFGPHYLSPYSGVIKAGIAKSCEPELVMYSLLCVAFVLPVWHLLAYWKQVPISPFTQLGKRPYINSLISCTLSHAKLASDNVMPGMQPAAWQAQLWCFQGQDPLIGVHTCSIPHPSCRV